jgi:hypothetical protein
MASVTDQCTVGKEGEMTLTDTVRDPDHTGSGMRWKPCPRGRTQSRFLKVNCNPSDNSSRPYTPVPLQHTKRSTFPTDPPERKIFEVIRTLRYMKHTEFVSDVTPGLHLFNIIG